jgi:Flp pilus assembly protein TadD
VGRLNYGAELITHGDYDGARAVFAESMAAEPNDPAPYMSLWRIAYAQQDYPEAVRLMLRANQLKKNNADAYANLALTYLHMDRLDDALVNMRTAAQLRPTDPTFLFAYGVMLEAKGDCALASDQFRAALEIRPGEAYAQLQLTRCQQILSRTSHN